MSSEDRRPPIREALGQRVLLLDGAMGTQLYARGMFINRSYDGLNLSSPGTVTEVHEAYLRAGCDVLTCNTFGSTTLRLAAFGLEAQADDIVRAGVRLAREVAGDRAWVAGSIGPTGTMLAPLGRLSPGEAFSAFRRQAAVMAEEGVDLFILETFSSTKELWQAFRAVRRVAPDATVIPCLSYHFGRQGDQLAGRDPEEAARTVTGWGASAVGVNCSDGPKTVLTVIERMAKATDLPLLAAPNAGLPQEVDGRLIYLAGPEYMAEYARRFVQKGATIIGGCCGTTPAMFKEIRSFVRSVSPGHRVVVEAAEDAPAKELAEPIPIRERTPFADKLYGGRFCVSAELDPPRGMDATRSLEGAGLLLEHGIDVINIADGPRAIARMGPAALAQLVKADSGMESVIHYCCRDRNLLGMQMDLIGAHALGLHNILAVTGDPPKMGNFPDATAVFDVDSIGLITFIQMMNRGLDFSNRPLGDRTRFFVGAGCNPAHVDLDLEVDRFGKKIEAGAEYFFSQPVYDADTLFAFLDRTEPFPEVPFLVGILPLASYKNAEFLHNEVPGMQVPESIRQRLLHADDRKHQRRIGIEVAQDALNLCKTHPRICGTYVYPPFGSYRAVMRVVEVLEDVRESGGFQAPQ